MDEAALQARLLEWYDANARSFPWRIPPGNGRRADPYAVWLSEIMLQQTTTATVRPYFEAFIAMWPDVKSLAAAEDEEVMAAWAGLGYYARARNLLKCARVVAQEHGGHFPDQYEALLKLPGIGPYTAAAVAAIAFDRPAVVVDGNVERVMARLHDMTTPLPKAKPALKAHAARLTPRLRPGDHAQALMDLGATICTPKSPACGLCPWRTDCRARAAGRAESLPRRAPGRAKPLRYGHVYLGRREDGAWLLERRPAQGLLGGMLGWPGSAWEEGAFPAPAPPVAGEWQEVGAEVRHTFTHFHLRLIVHVARLPCDSAPPCGFFMPASDFRPDDLPSVMRKAFSIAREALACD